MPARALIVLLLILNLGVALWWATREAPGPAAGPSLPAGVEPLRLLDEPDPSAPPAATVTVPGAETGTAPDAATAGAATADPAPSSPLAPDPLLRPAPPDPPSVAGAQRCHRFGPFPDAAAARRATAALRASALRLVARETRTAVRGWDVRMPGLPDRAAADAMATRLGAAGFGDHYLLPAADDGSVEIALGRFGSQDSAQRHRAALRAAGFDAVAVPGGDGGQAQHWLHVALAPGADLAALHRAAGAAQAPQVECATLDAPGR